MTELTLEALPDNTRCALLIGSGDLTVGELRTQLASRAPEVITTSQAHERWPRYAEVTWRKWAREGLISGAWQDGEGGPWSLPLEGCRARIEELSSRTR